MAFLAMKPDKHNEALGQDVDVHAAEERPLTAASRHGHDQDHRGAATSSLIAPPAREDETTEAAGTEEAGKAARLRSIGDSVHSS
jgi:hypothetical protein